MVKETDRKSPEKEVFVPKDKEQEYFQKHNIEFRELKNGIKIIGSTRNVEDVIDANISVDFATGGYNDPPGKEGLHHLLEHLIINDELQDKAHKLDSQFNGSTGNRIYQFTLEGVAHPSVHEFGVWPFLSGFRDTLANPLAHYQKPDEAIDKEKGVVLRELAEREANEDWKADRFAEKIIFDHKNPINCPSGGTKEGIANISRDDLEQATRQIFIPDRTVVSFTVAGNKQISSKLTHELEDLFEEFPRSDASSRPVSLGLCEKLNPNFDREGVYINTNIQNDISRVNFIWLMSVEDYSVESFALNRLGSLLSKKIHDYVRSQHLSYGASFGVFPLGKLRLAGAKFLLQSRVDATDFVAEVRNNILSEFKNIDDQEFEYVNQLEKLRQIARLMPVFERHSILLEGLSDYDRVVDGDKMKEMYQKITTGQMKDWRDRIVQTNPAIFVS